MELKLLYRVLRKISDWTIAGYYSETYVEGQYNVPEGKPVIIAATHHNELIDIATLAVTINHRRPLSFWAKSTLFEIPILGPILSSSGSIPVRRNPNNSGTTAASAAATSIGASSSAGNNSKGEETSARAALFLNTSKVLEAQQVVGVFPEGASYTNARILQVLPGTAWAAVEYARYLNKKRVVEKGSGYGVGWRQLNSELWIVPVAIVYTDKTKYLGRVYVKYGNPIDLDSYSRELFTGDPNESSKAVVKKITAQLQEQLVEMTPHASDWDTMCAVSMARDILWDEEKNVHLRDWVDVTQRLADMLVLPAQEESSSRSAEVRRLKDALTMYYALLHYAGMKHSILSSLLPPPQVASSPSSAYEIVPSPSVPKLSRKTLTPATLSILTSLPLSLIRFLFFLPPLLLHFPGYFTGPLLSKILSTPGEPESIDQYKAIGGGLGIGANIALALGVLWKKNKLGSLSALLGLALDDGSISASLKRILGLVGTVYCSVVVLIKWHTLLVNTNYRQLQRVRTCWRLFCAFIFPDSLSTAEVEPYTKPEHPAANLFVRKPTRRETPQTAPSATANEGSLNGGGTDASQAHTSEMHKPPKPIASRKLARHVLHARSAACAALWAHLDKVGDRNLGAFLKLKGAKIPVS